MENVQPSVHTIDYVKYIIEMDYDRMQDFMARFNSRESADKLGVKYGRDLKMSVLPGGEGGRARRRLVLESWGANSAMLIESMPEELADSITRLDYRITLPNIERRDLEAFVARAATSKKGRRNVQTFNSRPRQKDATRDVGGYGVYIGSRKSDSHTAAYQRGDETPAIEHRFQGHKCADIVARAIASMEHDEEPYSILKYIRDEMEQAARVELNTATGYKNWVALQMEMKNARDWYHRVQEASEWAELPEEQRFWEALPDDEKQAMLRANYVPTSITREEPLKREIALLESVTAELAEQANNPQPYPDQTGREWTDGDGRIVHVCGDACNPYVPFGDVGH